MTNSANLMSCKLASMLDNLAENVDEFSLNRGRYCLRAIVSAKTVPYTE